MDTIETAIRALVEAHRDAEALEDMIEAAIRDRDPEREAALVAILRGTRSRYDAAMARILEIESAQNRA